MTAPTLTIPTVQVLATIPNAGHQTAQEWCQAPCAGHVWSTLRVTGFTAGTVTRWRGWDFPGHGDPYTPTTVTLSLYDTHLLAVATLGDRPHLTDLWASIWDGSPSDRARPLTDLPAWLAELARVVANGEHA